jgi:hypothetical protein
MGKIGKRAKINRGIFSSLIKEISYKERADCSREEEQKKGLLANLLLLLDLY